MDRGVGRLQSLGLQRVRHDQNNLACTHLFSIVPLKCKFQEGESSIISSVQVYFQPPWCIIAVQ